MTRGIDFEQSEERFHDDWASMVDVSTIPVIEAFETAACPENMRILEWLGAGHKPNLRGKRVLELGCGMGESSVYFAMCGATVIATDISKGMLSITERLASRFEVEVETAQSSASDLAQFPQDAFDIVYAANVLHHVHIPSCMQQVYRVLRPGGDAFFWDPLAYNPLINLYRRKAKKFRTDDELPLTRADIAIIRSIFDATDAEFYWIAGLSVFIKYFIWDRLDPNEVRYWKRVVAEADKYSRFLRQCHGFDRLLIKLLPPVRYLAWNVLIRGHKHH